VSVTIEPVSSADPAFAAVRERIGYATADEPVPGAARCLIARRGGEAVARLATLAADDLAGAPGRSALAGWYEAAEREAGVALLRASTKTIDGASRVLGPVNGSTWGRYRLALASDLRADPPFLSEPVNPPEYADHFVEAGFVVAADYESAIVEELSAGDARAPEYLARLAARGATMRMLDADRFDEELESIYRLSVDAFAQNRFYAPIGVEEFRARYLPLRPVLDPDLVRLAVGADGGLLGFVFAFPDLLSAEAGRPRRVVLKTLATAPAARGLGLGSLLTDEVRRVAHEKGYRAVIHALMEAGNASVRISRHSARVFRRYALFEWTR
jgi:ribosomal protein S18 acetylase RimI-like enzyme